MSRGVTLNLGGKPRRLKYDLNAIAELGDRLEIQVRLDHLQEDLLGVPLPFSALRLILWAGLIHDNPDLDIKEVGGWVDMDNMKEVAQGFFQLFGARLPTQQQRQAVADKLGVEIPAEEPEPATT
jgi:hypothetical protein